MQQQLLAREMELQRRADFLAATDARKISELDTKDAIREYNDMWIGRQKANYTASKSGYEEAWDRTAAKLARETYVLRENNPYKDDDKKAILSLTKAVDYDPYNLEALLPLGTSYVNELNPTKALEALKAWVSHNPKFHGISVSPDIYSDGSLMDDVQQLMFGAKEFA